MAEPSGPPSFARLAVIGVLLAFTVVTVLTSVVPARDGLAATRRRLERREAENEALRQRKSDLDDEADALRTDPWLNRGILHEEFHVTDEGEVRVR